MKSKVCNKCGVVKDINEFYTRKLSPDGVMQHCKECQKELVALSKQKENDEDFIDVKRCSKCRRYKSFNEFYPDKRYKCGLSSQCRTCYCETAKIARLKALESLDTTESIEKVEPVKIMRGSIEKCMDCKFIHISNPIFQSKKKNKLESSLVCSYYKKFLGFTSDKSPAINLDFCKIE